MSGWELFSSHGLVLIYFSRHPRARLRDAADAVGLTERAVQNNIRDLAASGHLVIEKVGRRNRYRVVGRKHLTHATTRSVSLRQLLQLFKVKDVETAMLVTPAKKKPVEAKVETGGSAEVSSQGAQIIAEPVGNTEAETQSGAVPEVEAELIADISPEPETEAVQTTPVKSAKENKTAETKDKKEDALPQQDLLF
ncbi:MAG: hypothetical protein IMF09_10060 [Proteobacteria bacterium]|nr:hypothetical protein [Pseudomonadota bacterium]